MTDFVPEKRYTVEEFFEYTTGQNENKLFELVRGRIREAAGSSGKNAALAARISYFFNSWVMPRKLGFVTGADGSYVLHRNAPDTVRIPDVGFISKERLPKLPDDGFIPMPPDIAVEVISRSEGAEDIRDKVDEYLEYGVKIIWLVYPRKLIVDIYTQQNPTNATYRLDAVLDGGDVMPGFKLSVKEIFEGIEG